MRIYMYVTKLDSQSVKNGAVNTLKKFVFGKTMQAVTDARFQ